MDKTIQAKHLPDQQVMEAIAILAREAGARWEDVPQRWVMIWDLTEQLGAPHKVVLAKVRKLIKRGMLGGCACGCRGDLHVLVKGAETFGVEVYRDRLGRDDWMTTGDKDPIEARVISSGPLTTSNLNLARINDIAMKLLKVCKSCRMPLEICQIRQQGTVLERMYGWEPLGPCCVGCDHA
jgi:hypothetical protein